MAEHDPLAALRSRCVTQLREQGYALLAPEQTCALLQLGTDAARPWLAAWNDLPHDPHLADGGRYRKRRHASLIQSLPDGALHEVPYRPHWQPLAYNKLHGGKFRDFAPISEAVRHDPLYRHIVAGIGLMLTQLATVDRWHVEVHQFRIDASQGAGLPTPEGAHRDGVDFVALLLLHRGTLSGGKTSIHALDGQLLHETVLQDPWTLMLLDDKRVAHATTPIESTGADPVRDTLVVTWRAAGFLEPADPAKGN
jgi:hypothetical protein